ncbi:MAG: enoyl-CoA hydratase/isomerase family protein [Planctomycetales bacterium]|nr:enoyl-CoA hydratase/isomerase family protein [Planctomycetales bacterium]
MGTTIDLNLQDGVARVTFRTENGIHILDAQARSQLQDVLARLESEENCRVVVFQAEGRTFLAGADIREMHQLTPATAREYSREGQHLMRRIARLPAVTVAAIHAPCVGGGCEMALCCDLRLAAASTRIGLPEVSLGMIPGWGGTVRATRLLGPAVARRLILTAELLDAETALRIGLLDAVFSDDQFRAAIDQRVAQLLTRAPQAAATSKRLTRAFSGEHADDELFAQEANEFGNCFQTLEPSEGMGAFLDKRPPNWEPKPSSS